MAFGEFSIGRFSFVIFIALLSLSVVVRGRSQTAEPRVDVYFVPISAANEHIARGRAEELLLKILAHILEEERG